MPALPERDLSRAVLIGTSQFDRLPDLPAVRNNLTELSRSLTDPSSGILSEDNCSIVDSPETTVRFLRRLRSVAMQAEDLLLVYYAGHGLRHETRDQLYLTVQDTDPEEPEATAVRFESVRELIESSPARTRLLILDCCYSGLALGAMSSGAIDPREVAVGGTAVITSSPRNKISHSPPGQQFTAFTGEFISLLRNGSRIPGEPLTVRTAFLSLQAAMAMRDLPEPKLKYTDTGSDLILRRSPPPPPAPPPTPPAPEAPKAAPKPVVWPQPRPSPELMPVRQAPLIDVLLPTVPTLRPVAPPPVQHAQRPKIFKRLIGALLADSGWLLLWVVCALAASYGIGGFVAVLANGSSVPSFGSDLGTGIGGIAVAAVIGIVLWKRSLRLRRRGGQSPERVLGPSFERIFAKVRTSVLIAVAVLCALTGAIGPTAGTTATTSNTGPQSLSTLATTVAVECFFAWGLLACGYTLYRRWRPRNGVVALADTPLTDPQVQS
jgi:hypothetical protein